MAFQLALYLQFLCSVIFFGTVHQITLRIIGVNCPHLGGTVPIFDATVPIYHVLVPIFPNSLTFFSPGLRFIFFNGLFFILTG